MQNLSLSKTAVSKFTVNTGIVKVVFVFLDNMGTASLALVKV